METKDIVLEPLNADRREEFIRMNQASFQVAVDEEFGPGSGEAIPRRDIEESLDSPLSHPFAIMCDGEMVGGAVCQINPKSVTASLDLLFVDPRHFGRGIGYSAWNILEKMYPDVRIWETHTPYFEKRNIHFYVNKCGFSIVEFCCPQHPMQDGGDFPGSDYFFRFEKRMF